MDGMMMLTFEEMRPEEQMIIESLRRAQEMGVEMLHISDLQAVNGWDKAAPHFCGSPAIRCQICIEAARRGNSKVRNNLRRLMKFGWIHRPLDGTYALAKAGLKVDEPIVEPPQPVVRSEPEPPQPAKRSEPPLVIIRKKNRTPAPVEMTEEQAHDLRVRMYARGEVDCTAEIKRLDCTFYNACLDQAISGQWAGFSCQSCTAYAAPDRHQMEIDVLGLLAVNKARELLEKHGKIMRVRGAKPGVDAKRPVDDDEDDLAEAG